MRHKVIPNIFLLSKCYSWPSKRLIGIPVPSAAHLGLSYLSYVSFIDMTVLSSMSFCDTLSFLVLELSSRGCNFSIGLRIVYSLRPVTLLKKRLWYRCFPVNFAKLLRTLFLTEHLRWLFLLNGKIY